MADTKSDLQSLLDGRCADPHAILGMHAAKKGRSNGLAVRARLQGAVSCEVVAADGAAFKMKAQAEGLFELFIPGRTEFFRYQLRAAYPGGESRQFSDPYS